MGKVKKKNKKGISKKIVIFAIVLVIVCGGVGISLCFLDDEKKPIIPNIIPTTEAYDKNYSYTTTIDALETYYLALNGKKTFVIEYSTDDNYDNTISWVVEDESIISMENNTMKGLKVGTTKVTGTLKNGFKRTYEVMVTDLIVPAKVDHKKKALPCKQYTKEQADLLDKILESRVIEGGVGSRGGVLAAARFITLEFPYLIKYFNENGRLPFTSESGKQVSIKKIIDGEGRYYHKGLYLHESKFQDLYKNESTGKTYSTKSGPAIWGCSLYDEFMKKYKANGLTCSGFVTWAMLNGGFDVGDLGAGTLGHEKELWKLGTHHEITRQYIDGGTYKVGDYIARQGHAALIIGIDETSIYVAEELPRVSIGAGGSSGNLDLNAYVYGKYDNKKPLPGHNKKGILVDGNLTYVIEMSDIYPNGDGWYTDMWES